VKVTFELTIKAVLVAVVYEIPTYWRTKPAPFSTPRAQILQSRSTLTLGRCLKKRRAAAKRKDATSLRKANVYGSTYARPTFMTTKDVPQSTPEKAIIATGARIVAFKPDA
jgi:hypothetical protein